MQLPYGLEGFAPGRHLMKEDGKQIGADETAQFMVIEFDRNEKRIVLSHTRIWEQAKVEERKKVPGKKQGLKLIKQEKQLRTFRARLRNQRLVT